MRRLVLASLLLALGCRGRSLDEKLDRLDKIKAALCACRDKACADKQDQAFVAWKKGNSKADQDAASDAQRKRFFAIREDMKKCQAKLERKKKPSSR